MINENAGVDEEVLGAEDEQELNEEDRAPDSQEDETDWKAVALAERERAENYKKSLTQKRGLRKQGAPPIEDEQEVEDDDGDKPLTRNEFQELLRETVLPVVTEGKVDMILSDMVKDPAKREAVKLIYENRVRQTGTSDAAIRDDVEAAIGIADRAKNRKTLNEIERVRDRSNTPPLNGTGNEHGLDAKKHGFTEAQVKELTKKAQSIQADPDKFIAQAWALVRRR